MILRKSGASLLDEATVAMPFSTPTLTRLWKAALGTEHEQFHIFVHQLLKNGVGVGTIDNGTLIILAVARLSKKAAQKI